MLIILSLVVVYILIGLISYYITVQFHYEEGDEYDDNYGLLMLICIFWIVSGPVVLICYISEQFNKKVFNDAKKRLEIKEIAENLYKDNQAGRTPLISKKEAYKEAKRIYNSKKTTT